MQGVQKFLTCLPRDGLDDATKQSLPFKEISQSSGPLKRGSYVIIKLTSVRDVWKKKPTGHHVLLFLDNAIRGADQFCPLCDSLYSRPLPCASVRPCVPGTSVAIPPSLRRSTGKPYWSTFLSRIAANSAQIHREIATRNHTENTPTIIRKISTAKFAIKSGIREQRK